jgi:hypothetical protein
MVNLTRLTHTWSSGVGIRRKVSTSEAIGFAWVSARWSGDEADSANQPAIFRFWNSVSTARHALQSLAVPYHDLPAVI